MRGKPIVGLIGFSDGDPEVHEKLKEVVQRQVDVIAGALRESGQAEVVLADRLAASERDAEEQARLLRDRGVDATVFSYGAFAFPNFSAIAARNGKGPFILAANLNPEWPGMVAMLAAGGALNHLGIRHYRVAGDFNDPAVLDRLLRYARCGRAASRLNGQKYGLIGGRSLGMYSAVVSMQDWQRQFGVDVDHLDQAEILRIGETVPQTQVDKAMAWLKEHLKDIRYDARQLTPEKLELQIRHYEAVKRIIKEHRYDFVGVKCHYEMSRHHCTQCISAAFCNDPYDWDGPKEPVVYACEADGDAALTMQILKLLTGAPVLFMDVRHYDAERDVMVFCNCGSQSTYYAAASDDYRENLKKVTLYPALDIYAGGGCHVNCMTHPGRATIARLNRKEGVYRMTLILAEFVTLPEEKMAETTGEWPHVFAKLPFEHGVFLENFDANHCHAVYGDHIESLKIVCDMLNINCEVMGG